MDRPVWQPKNLTVFALLAYTVGLGNIWRFPYLCLKHGGLVFVVAYLCVVVLVAFPLLVLFMVPAQYCGRSSLVMLAELAPAAVGVGWSLILIEAITAVYYNVYITWIMYYFYAIVSGKPWLDEHGDSVCYRDTSNSSGNKYHNYSARQFINDEVIYTANKPWTGFGEIVPHNAACLTVTWVCVFMFLSRNIFKATKMLYFFVLLPLVLLIFLCMLVLFASTSYESAVKVEWTKLQDFPLWVDAFKHIFFTFGLTLSGVPAISSHNSILRNLIWDAFLQVIFDFLVSLVAFVLVSLALQGQHSTDDLVGYITVYPKAMAFTSAGCRLSSFFFVMVFCVGVNSQVMGVQSLIINVSDRWERLRAHRVLVSGSVCALMLLLGLPLTTRAGKSLVLLLERATTGPASLLVCLLHALVISRGCGFQRLAAIMSGVLQLKMPLLLKLYFRATWMLVTPLVLLLVFIFSIITFVNEDIFEHMSNDRTPPTAAGTQLSWTDPDVWGEVMINVVILAVGLVFSVHAALAGPSKGLLRPTPSFAPQFYRSSFEASTPRPAVASSVPQAGAGNA